MMSPPALLDRPGPASEIVLPISQLLAIVATTAAGVTAAQRPLAPQRAAL
jgi:hypothetical protein